MKLYIYVYIYVYKLTEGMLIFINFGIEITPILLTFYLNSIHSYC